MIKWKKIQSNLTVFVFSFRFNSFSAMIVLHELQYYYAAIKTTECVLVVVLFIK